MKYIYLGWIILDCFSNTQQIVLSYKDVLNKFIPPLKVLLSIGILKF